MNTPKIPTALIHFVANELIERSLAIKHLPTLMREISPAPLPIDTFTRHGLTAPLSQWRLANEQVEPSLLRSIKSMFGKQIEQKTWAQLASKESHQPAAQLVFAPFVLNATNDVLAAFELLPYWFADDGVLLFATFAAGGLPELVNAQPEWLELLTHWPNIMDAGARLQALNFSLPVLDVESVPLNYSDFETLWHDVKAFLPALQTMDVESRVVWQNRLNELFDLGLRDISLQILYGQVWQVRARKQATTEHTVSLESLTSQLEHRKTYQ